MRQVMTGGGWSGSWLKLYPYNGYQNHCMEHMLSPSARTVKPCLPNDGCCNLGDRRVPMPPAVNTVCFRD